MLDQILLNAPVYLLIFIRCFTMIVTMPLFSMRSASRVAKVALAGYCAYFILGSGMNDGTFAHYASVTSADGAASMEFFLIAVGEGLIGIILGFFVSIMFAAFSSAGQFMGFQMGLSAASSYDAMSQVENPLMGQFFNLIAMLVFLQTRWFQELFMGGLTQSFKTMNAFTLAASGDQLVHFLISGLTGLFRDGVIIALPVMGTLFLITVCTGLLTKAAPQMNLLSEGFPIMILVAYFIIGTVMPDLIDFFVRSFRSSCNALEQFFIQTGGLK